MPKGTYPPFNEEYYTMLVKKQSNTGDSLDSLEPMLMSTLALASSIIGLIICWIPLLIWLVSIPFVISGNRRAAYKLYVEECEKIKARRRHNYE